MTQAERREAFLTDLKAVLAKHNAELEVVHQHDFGGGRSELWVYMDGNYGPNGEVYDEYTATELPISITGDDK
jgi:hypothetical protein